MIILLKINNNNVRIYFSKLSYKQRRNNKSKISSLISEAVVAKRKEKTRDVIAEDLIRMIKGY